MQYTGLATSIENKALRPLVSKLLNSLIAPCLQSKPCFVELLRQFIKIRKDKGHHVVLLEQFPLLVENAVKNVANEDMMICMESIKFLHVWFDQVEVQQLNSQLLLSQVLQLGQNISTSLKKEEAEYFNALVSLCSDLLCAFEDIAQYEPVIQLFLQLL